MKSSCLEFGFAKLPDACNLRPSDELGRLGVWLCQTPNADAIGVRVLGNAETLMGVCSQTPSRYSILHTPWRGRIVRSSARHSKCRRGLTPPRGFESHPLRGRPMKSDGLTRAMRGRPMESDGLFDATLLETSTPGEDALGLLEMGQALDLADETCASIEPFSDLVM
jgi:hypothetical protein